MKKMLLIVVMLGSLVSGVFGGECDDDKYYYSNGHRSVFPNDVFDRKFAKNIKVCINDNVPSLWKEASKSAIFLLNSELSTTTSILRFSYGSNDCYVNINISYDLPYNKYAQVLPFSGKLIPGKPKIVINGNNKIISSFTLMKSIMMHELLHSIGIFHTGHNIAYKIPNTDGYFDTKYAGRSIMCSVADSDIYPQRHFNFLDKRALEVIYPR